MLDRAPGFYSRFALNKKFFLPMALTAMVLAWSTCAHSKDNGTIKALLDMQANAWNKGDLKTFMTGYKRSKETSYTSGCKIISGYDALQAHYQKRYGNSSDTMGKLDFTILQTVDLGKNNALCVGRWHLVGKDKKEMGGVFSLVLSRSDEKSDWKVVHDHTSLNSSAEF
jgi:beta-aspartyl-peptidase (threonine type)